MDEKVLKLHADITISFELQKKNGVDLPLSYFRISYQNPNPALAQKIASKLTSLFIEQDNKTPRDTGFLEQRTGSFFPRSWRRYA